MIPEIPDLPHEIKKAAINRNLVIFIGAGVSMQLGCKNWAELANNLIKKCYKVKSESGVPCINFRERKSLNEEYDYKKVITMCYNILKTNGHESLFFDELKESLKGDEDIINQPNIYDELRRLDAIYITTNADEHFDPKFDIRNLMYKKGDFNSSEIKNLNLYHIHGSLKDEESLVFTVERYISRYNDREFKNFLDEIFDKYLILFLGYSMNEFELIDYLISKVKKEERSEKEIQHFILLPFYAHEDNLLNFYQFYYNEMKIKVIGYAYDKKGYSQLYKILQKWNSEIFFESKDEIDRLLQ